MRIYYGWIIVAISSVLLLLVLGTTVSVYGLYVLPVAEDYNLSRADVNTAFVVANLGGAVLAPIIGRLADTYPVRIIMAISALFYMGGLIILGYSHNIWLSAIVVGVAFPIVIAGIVSSGAMTLVARWFEAQRARAMAIAVIGMSLGSVVMAPIVGWMIGEFGWRNSVIGQGAVIGTLFLVLIFFLKERPSTGDIEPLPKGAEQTPAPVAMDPASLKPLTTKQLLRVKPFLLLMAAMALSLGMLQAVAITLVPMVQEQGVDVTSAAGILSVMGITGLVGKFALAVIGDKFNKQLALVVMMAAMALSIALMPFSDKFTVILILAGMLGLAGSAVLPLCMTLMAEYVGASSFASANGMASFGMALTGAIAMRASGEIYDRTGSYDGLFVGLAVCIVFATLLMLVISRIPIKKAVPAHA